MNYSNTQLALRVDMPRSVQPVIYIHKAVYQKCHKMSVTLCVSVLAKSCDWSKLFMQVILPVLSLVRIRVFSDHPQVCPE